MNVLTYEQLKQQLDAVVAECAELREQSEEVYAAGYNHGHLNTVDGIAYAPGTKDEFYSLALRVMAEVETPNVTAALAEVEAKAIEKFADKRGFSFQHGSIHAHFGNGDVLVGSTTFENGHAGICFAPVREKDGGVGTEYKWTEGKNTDEVGAVFVISSCSVTGLEVIQAKLSEAIEQLREGRV